MPVARSCVPARRKGDEVDRTVGALVRAAEVEDNNEPIDRASDDVVEGDAVEGECMPMPVAKVFVPVVEGRKGDEAMTEEVGPVMLDKADRAVSRAIVGAEDVIGSGSERGTQKLEGKEIQLKRAACQCQWRKCSRQGKEMNQCPWLM